ncbi:MAG: hypothetical protein PVH82_04975 [Desulfobacteraceae bacterium]|jgi:hypothetical protein
MNRGKDFSLAIYENLVGSIKRSGFKILTLREYFSQRPNQQAFVILRHDVDRRPENALRMALLESSFGIQSTYYFRVQRRNFQKEIIEEVHELGHEIGYHYEVMDKAKGDLELAERIFSSELSRLRALADVNTVCMHGNPFSRWDNRDFWKHFSLPQFNLLGEAYVSIRDPELFYVTDTGRGWNRAAYNLKDTFSDVSVRLIPSLSSTWELIDLICSQNYQKIYLQIHPNRWSRRWLEWHRQLGEDLCINWAKALAGHYFKRK